MTTLADKLRSMTEARGCLPAEAATLAAMLAKLPPERLNAEGRSRSRGHSLSTTSKTSWRTNLPKPTRAERYRKAAIHHARREAAAALKRRDAARAA